MTAWLCGAMTGLAFGVSLMIIAKKLDRLLKAEKSSGG